MKKIIAVYPGSFDPPTFGHIDILRRAARLYDTVVVAVTINTPKVPTFSLQERILMLRRETKNLHNVQVEAFSELLVDYTRKKKAQLIIRGLRAVSDFEYEFQMALTNRKISKGIETVFLMSDEEYIYISSSLVKEIARLGGSVKELVPLTVKKALDRKYGTRKVKGK